MQNFHLVNLFIRAEHEHENLIKIRINPHGVCHVVNRIREKVSVENQRFRIEQPGMRYKKYSLTFVRKSSSSLTQMAATDSSYNSTFKRNAMLAISMHENFWFESLPFLGCFVFGARRTLVRVYRVLFSQETAGYFYHSHSIAWLALLLSQLVSLRTIFPKFVSFYILFSPAISFTCHFALASSRDLWIT